MAHRAIAPLVGEIFKKIAPKIGATVLMEPHWGFVGQIAFRSGRKRYFRFSSLDINPLGASEIAKDKDFANFFMARLGYPIVPGKTFFSAEWARKIRSKRNIDAAYSYAKKRGFPVVIKPNSGSQGVGFALVHTRADFYKNMREIFKRDKVALVQEQLSGKDYRVVVLDDKIISAYQRIPLNVVGDSRSTILSLLKRKQQYFRETGRDTKIKTNDPRILSKLKRMGMSMSSIPKEAQTIYLLDNANLSAGGESVDVTSSVHTAFNRIAVKLTREMGLRLCGVDIMVDGDIAEKHNRYWVLEINSAPGLDHYARTGARQERIVERLYLKVLKSMDR